jgi:GntR family transcriptional regulator/MocR family aminotransferase
MTRPRSGAILTQILLDRGGAIPLWRQLEDQLRDAIIAGHLPGETRLPSSRVLAVELGVSRPTVVMVLERLEAEGYLEMRWGAGTFVAPRLPLQVPRAVDRSAESGGATGEPPVASELGARLLRLSADIGVREDRAFVPNTPAYDHFPFAIWQNCVNRQTRRAYRANMGYADPAGYEPLGAAIAAYLGCTAATPAIPTRSSSPRGRMPPSCWRRNF